MTPPRKKPPTPNVARLTPDEQISYLFHQYEGFADWRIGVDEKLDKVDSLAVDVAALRSESHKTSSGIHEILVFLKGQQTPGLERPGLSHDFATLRAELQADKKKQEEKYAEMEKRYATADELHQKRIDALEQADTNRKAYLAGGAAVFTLAAGGAGLYFREFLSHLYQLIMHAPLNTP